MRCAKCGYVSFDHLSECKHCRTSMSATRDGFGFFAAKPAAPSLLGSLLSGYEPPTPKESSVVETELSNPFSFGKEAGGGFRQEKPESRTAETASAVANPDESGEDFSLLDLSDEELELLIDKESLGSGNVSGGTDNRLPEPILADEPAASAFEISPPEGETQPEAVAAPDELAMESDEHTQRFQGETQSEAVAAPDDLALEFDERLQKFLQGETQSEAVVPPDELALEFDEFPQKFHSEPEITPNIEPTPELIADPAGLKEGSENPAECKPGSEQAWLLPDDSANDFVIELSENDLDALLEELGSSPKGTT
jgi:hypothetical protein